MSGVGEWVVCVDDSPAPGGLAVPLAKGEVYQIEAVWGDLPHGNETVGLGEFWRDVGLDLVGVPRVIPDLCYGAHRFREMVKPEPVAALEAHGALSLLSRGEA
jgi:hypothetical protein